MAPPSTLSALLLTAFTAVNPAEPYSRAAQYIAQGTGISSPMIGKLIYAYSALGFSKHQIAVNPRL